MPSIKHTIAVLSNEDILAEYEDSELQKLRKEKTFWEREITSIQLQISRSQRELEAAQRCADGIEESIFEWCDGMREELLDDAKQEAAKLFP